MSRVCNIHPDTTGQRISGLLGITVKFEFEDILIKIYNENFLFLTKAYSLPGWFIIIRMVRRQSMLRTAVPL